MRPVRPFIILYSILLSFAAAANAPSYSDCSLMEVPQTVVRGIGSHAARPATISESRTPQRLFRAFKAEHENQRTLIKSIFEKPLNGGRVLVIQFKNIKDLNEKIWGYQQTEELLEAFHLYVSETLIAHPKLGHVIQSNFKNHFIVSNQSSQEFIENVIEPWARSFEKWLQKNRPRSYETLRSNSIDVSKWARKNIWVAEGQSILEAHLNLAGQPTPTLHAKVNYESWRHGAVLRRKMLAQAAARAGVPWTEVIGNLHDFISRNNGGVARFEVWLRSVGLDRFYNQFKGYLDDLNVGDFLYTTYFRDMPANTYEELVTLRQSNPLGVSRMSWEVERRAAFEINVGAAYMITTDFRELGKFARLSQDEFIARGAQLKGFAKVYRKLRQVIFSSNRKIHRDLENIVGNRIGVYQTGGDEAIWFFPEMSPQIAERVVQYLDSVVIEKFGFRFSFHRSQLTPMKRNGSEVERALRFGPGN